MINNTIPNSPVLRTIHYLVRQKYPNCRVMYHATDDPNPTLEFRFFENDRQENHLYTAQRKYPIINGHVFYGNGFIDPFAQDELAQLIENIELNMEVNHRRKFAENTRAALEKAQEFYDNTLVFIANLTEVNGSPEFDIQTVHNDTDRFYRFINDGESHLLKEDPVPMGEDVRGYSLRALDSSISLKIMRTLFPGLRPDATEYIVGIRDDKEDWKSAEDAYIDKTLRRAYSTFNLKPLDIVSDTMDIIAIADQIENPMRHLVLADGREYAYRFEGKETKLEPQNDYINQRNRVLSDYQSAIIQVCRKTKVTRELAIAELNTSKKLNTLYFKDTDEAILNIIKRLHEDPFYGLNERVSKAVIKENPNVEFITTLRPAKNDPYKRYININWNGRNYKMSITVEDNMFFAAQDPHMKHKTVPPVIQDYFNKLYEETEKLETTVYGTMFLTKKALLKSGQTALESRYVDEQYEAPFTKDNITITLLPDTQQIIIEGKEWNDLPANMQNEILTATITCNEQKLKQG